MTLDQILWSYCYEHRDEEEAKQAIKAWAESKVAKNPYSDLSDKHDFFKECADQTLRNIREGE